jgi:hypothetical protein
MLLVYQTPKSPKLVTRRIFNPHAVCSSCSIVHTSLDHKAYTCFVISTTFRPTHIVWHSLLSLNCCLILVNTIAFVLHEMTKIHLKYSQNASASGGRSPPDPLPGLRPWTPLEDLRPPDPRYDSGYGSAVNIF